MKVELSNIAVPLDAMLAGREGLLEAEVSRACGCALRLCAGADAGLRADGGSAPGGSAAAGAGALAPVCDASVAEDPVLAPNTFCVRRRSVDARRKSDVHFVVTVVAEVAHDGALEPAKGVRLRPFAPCEPLAVPDMAPVARVASFRRPIVVGAGPAGLFCALYLAEAGLAPLVVERGKPVEERMRDVEAFFAGGALDADSNVQFGEGGAGTFSDGKLNTGTKGPHIRHVLEALAEAGAPREVLVDAKPHIGTDLLPGVVGALRRRIERAGGTFAFGMRLEGAGRLPEGGVRATFCDVASGETSSMETDALVCALGHSARDTFSALRDAGVDMQRKPFAVGVRVEHLQADVDAAQYGPAAGHPALGPADYKLAVHDEEGRGVYTFCMCPGGTVVAAASEEGGVCVNGMSDSARSGRNANSALLVGVEPADVPGDDVLEGMRLQRRMEQAAFAAASAQAPFTAPVQRVADFLEGTFGTPSATVVPTYPRAVAWTDLGACLPPFVASALREAFPHLARKLGCFADGEAVLCGVEARSSSPVRIVRDRDSMQSPGMPGLFPAGEGAGYAGGITSAAVDGLRVAEAVCSRYAALAPGRAGAMREVRLRP